MAATEQTTETSAATAADPLAAFLEAARRRLIWVKTDAVGGPDNMGGWEPSRGAVRLVAQYLGEASVWEELERQLREQAAKWRFDAARAKPLAELAGLARMGKARHEANDPTGRLLSS